MWLVKVFTPADAPVESSALCAQANCRTPSESSNVRSQPRQPVFLDGSLVESLEGSFRNAMLGVSNLALGTWTRWIEIDRKSTRLNSSHRCISYAVFCLQK